jgi:hypothetical protein
VRPNEAMTDTTDKTLLNIFILILRNYTA